MPQVRSGLTIQLQAMPHKYGYLNAPPKAITTMAMDIQGQDNGYIDAGRYLPHLGAIGSPDVRLPMDTFITGSAVSGSRSGRSFALVSGLADDTWLEPAYKQWGIHCYDGTSGASSVLLAATTASAIEQATLTIWRGNPANGGTAATAANCYTYFELCSGSTRNFRIAWPFGEPLQLQFTTDGGTNWKPVAKASANGSRSELTFTSVDYVVLFITTYPETGTIVVDSSAGHVLRWTPNDAWTLTHAKNAWLPATGRIKVSNQNGWMGFTYTVRRHGTTQVGRVHNIGYAHPQAAAGWLAAGALNKQSGLSYTNSVASSGSNITWTSQVNSADAGEGKGSAFNNLWTDGQLLIPPDFKSTTDGVPGGTNPTTIVQLRSRGARIVEILDDNARTHVSGGVIDINNNKHTYGTAAGHLACTVFSSNNGGTTLVKRGEFIAGGKDGYTYVNPQANIYDLGSPIFDRSYAMGNCDEPVVLEDDLVADGWPLWSLVRFLAHHGNVSDDWLIKLPDAGTIYVPPGAPGSNAPYGRAGSSYTGEIMPSGLGDKPIYVFPAGMSPWAALQHIVQELTAQVPDGLGGTRTVPYYMGFDHDGYFRFEPFDPLGTSPVFGFTDNVAAATTMAPGIIWTPLTHFQHAVSVGQLRSSLTLTGQDWVTNELLVDHRLQSSAVREAIGFYRGLRMQSERWGSDTYITKVGNGLQLQTSLSTLVCAGSSVHVPSMYCGDTIAVMHTAMGGTVQKFYVTRLVQDIADAPQNLLETQFTARYVADF